MEVREIYITQKYLNTYTGNSVDNEHLLQQRNGTTRDFATDQYPTIRTVFHGSLFYPRPVFFHTPRSFQTTPYPIQMDCGTLYVYGERV